MRFAQAWVGACSQKTRSPMTSATDGWSSCPPTHHRRAALLAPLVTHLGPHGTHRRRSGPLRTTSPRSDNEAQKPDPLSGQPVMDRTLADWGFPCGHRVGVWDSPTLRAGARRV
ncbi:MAG: hypothetical protein V7646_6494 [Pseudonocardia sp.]|jgi:hypothetical protein